ncbi:TPA: hypothetical protein ACJXXT_000163 [Pseudomonas aeruginosa]
MMENKNNGLPDYKVIEMIAFDISQSKYEAVNAKMLGRLEAGYYDKSELATAEAFYTEFKNFGMEELRSVLEANEIIAKDGLFITKEGLQIEYEKVIKKVVETANIEQYVDRFLSSNFGDEYAKRYEANLAAQKEFAIEIYTNFFDNHNISPSNEIIRDISIYNIYDDVKDSMHEHTILETGYSANAKFGVPKFELSRHGLTAEFSSGVEVKHMLNEKETIDQIKYLIANPAITEDLQEDVWLRNPLNKKPNLMRP